MRHIPPLMHHIWIGPDPLPAEFSEYRHRWIELHPGWLHKLWGNENSRRHMTPPLARLWDRAETIAPGSVEQFRADVLRYELLHRFGGVYVDADFEPQQSLTPLLEDVSCFLAWEEDGVWLNNAIMGAVPFHPFIGEIVAGLPRSVDRAAGRHWRPNKISGPQYITPIYQAGGAGVTVYPSRLFYPYLYSELERGGEAFPDAYAVHHWNNRRRLVEGARP